MTDGLRPGDDQPIDLAVTAQQSLRDADVGNDRIRCHIRGLDLFRPGRQGGQRRGPTKDLPLTGQERPHVGAVRDLHRPQPAGRRQRVESDDPHAVQPSFGHR